MKKAHLEEVIKKRLQRMESLCVQIPGVFDIEVIHDLRVEYKKLRAFVRMLQWEEESSKLKVPGKLKSVYEAGGPVRDLQLFLPLLQPYCDQLVHYHERLEEKLGTEKENLEQAIGKVSFGRAEESLLSHLPGKLQADTVNKFALHKIAAIQAGMHAIHDDEDLHTIRKQLKDLIYNIKVYTSEWNQPFPVALGNGEEELIHAARLLGNYNDLCFAVTFIQNNHEEGLPQEESLLLEKLEGGWLAEKENRQEEVISKLNALQFVQEPMGRGN